MARDLLVDPDALREQVRGKYCEGKARAFEVYGYAFMTCRPPEAPAGPGR